MSYCFFPEQDLFVSNEKQSSLQSRLSNLNEVLELQKKELDSLGKDRSQRMAVMRELEAERDQLMLAKVCRFFISIKDLSVFSLFLNNKFTSFSFFIDPNIFLEA